MVPLAVMYLRAELDTRVVLADARRNQLGTLAESLGRSLDVYLQERQRAVQLVAAYPAIRAVARDDAWTDAARTGAASEALRSGAYAQDRWGLVDRAGTVRLATDQRLQGLNAGQSPAVQAALSGTAAIGELANEASAPVLRIAAPVQDGSSTTGAVLLYASPDEIWNLMAGVRAGSTGSSVLVDERGIVIGHSTDQARLFTPYAALSSASGDTALRHTVESAVPSQVLDVLTGEAMGQGQAVSTRTLTVRPWTVLVTQDNREAFSSLQSINDAARLTAILVMLFAAVVAAAVALSIARPISRMQSVLAAAARGDLAQRARLRRSDELGQLGAQVDGTLDALATLVKDAGHAADTASATSTQVAAATNQQAAAMAEVSATIEELARSAEQVAGSADSTLRAAEAARGGVAGSMESLERIDERTRSLGERLTALAEMSQRIGEVADLIGEITNKTHLLSVNASIEAASAGEFGRRFAVVAQQVKQLADETREAAGEVKQLIRQTQSAVAAAVVASESVAREVGQGVGIARQTDQTIDTMVHQVRTISLATQQQLTANRQVADAVAGTTDAVKQVAVVMEDLEQRVRALRHRLDELSVTAEAPIHRPEPVRAEAPAPLVAPTS